MPDDVALTGPQVAVLLAIDGARDRTARVIAERVHGDPGRAAQVVRVLNVLRARRLVVRAGRSRDGSQRWQLSALGRQRLARHLELRDRLRRMCA